MGGELQENPRKRAKLQKNSKKTAKPLQLNPNWAQLQLKLKINGSRYPRTDMADTEPADSVLGKRKERDEAEPNDSQQNPLTPVNDDCSLTDAIAMDCEMVGVGEGNKSALGRITLVNRWGNVVYDEFVRPMERVVDFRTQISGIRPQYLRKAKSFPVVQKKVAELIKGRILVGHALHNDLKALLMSHPKEDIRDTTQFKPYQNEGRKKALRHLASEVLGVTIQNGEHCPVEDARAAMLLYVKNSKKWEKSMKDESRVKQLKKKRRPKKRIVRGNGETCQ